MFIRSNIAQNDFFDKLLADDQALFKNFSRMSLEDLVYHQKVRPMHLILPSYLCIGSI